MNAFQVKCRTCSALVMMDQDPTTKKWRPMDEKDGQLVPHWPACEENQRQRRKNEEAEQLQLDVAYRSGRRQEARRRRENMRDLVKGTTMERSSTTVIAADGFEDDLPWKSGTE